MGLLDKTTKADVKKGPIKTRLDSIYEEVKKNKKLPLTEIAQKFDVSEEQAESWAKLLESQGLVMLSYPAVGGIMVNAMSNEKTSKAGWNKKTKLIVFACVATLFMVAVVYMLVKFLSDGGT
jgi:DeoR/GlpR family transcriptional regulator of sugar metabolism